MNKRMKVQGEIRIEQAKIIKGKKERDFLQRWRGKSERGLHQEKCESDWRS